MLIEFQENAERGLERAVRCRCTRKTFRDDATIPFRNGVSMHGRVATNEQDRLYIAAAARFSSAIERLARGYEADADLQHNLVQEIHAALWRSYSYFERQCSERTWMFAALNTVEPPIVEWEMVQYFEKEKAWRDERKTMIEAQVRKRLSDLSTYLGDAAWIEGSFSAADVLMILAMRRLYGSGIVEEFPNLAAYVARGEARPAYRRAFADQLEVFHAASADSASEYLGNLREYGSGAPHRINMTNTSRRCYYSSGAFDHRPYPPSARARNERYDTD